MLANFSNFVSRQSLETKVFSAIIVAAIAVRVFALFAMPDPPMTDPIYHLTITKYIIQNHALPFYGIPGTAVANIPVPFYHVLMAIPFTLLPIAFNLVTAKIFPFIFSFLQLLLSFLLLRELFPKNWHIGFAFVAFQPLLVIFGALNYLETFASVLILLCFFVYWRFVKTGRNLFLLVMPFALAGMAISKESATALVPAFFLAFLFELWVKRPKPVSTKRLAKALAVCNGSRELRFPSLRKLFLLLFALTAIYSLLFASVFVLHFNADFNSHVPLYDFVKELPAGSRIAIHSNKTRQIAFISEKQAVPHAEFTGFDAQQLYAALNNLNVTHLAETCYQSAWDRKALEQLLRENHLQQVFKDGCSTLYQVKR